MPRFFVRCAKGLEYLLADELLALGCSKATAALAGANAEGDLATASRVVLWSRLASRVVWPLGEFECPDDQALYDGVRALPWHEHLDASCTIAIDAVVSGEAITHSRYAAQRVKDAVVDQLRERTGARPSVDVQDAAVRIAFVLRKGWAEIAIDLGGGPLHRRGWRQKQGAAPLKENVAAAMLLRGGWPAAYAAGGSLCDPMCGSGTLLIEGAAMVADVAPGILRHRGKLPTRWFGFDAALWKRELRAAEQRAREGREQLDLARFEGSDLDPKAIEAAQLNAEAAGFAGVRWNVRAVSALPNAPAPGVVVCNPPYAERMAADEASYRELGASLLRARPEWRAALLCGNAELAQATGLRGKKKYQLFNGALECALLVCDPIAGRPHQRLA